MNTATAKDHDTANKAVVTAKPNFTHDCKHCTFLGLYRDMDLYHCEQIGIPTVIARYGNDGRDYTSGMSAADAVPALGEARLRAERMGLRLRP